MTENEEKLLEKLDELANDTEVDMYSVANLNFFFEESANTIRKLIKEIQEYRAIGTVEELINTQIREKVLNVEVESYKEIGTIEEFKDLKEKSVAKKADYDNYDEIYICPNCEKSVGEHQNYCWNCGQAFET